MNGEESQRSQGTAKCRHFGVSSSEQTLFTKDRIKGENNRI